VLRRPVELKLKPGIDNSKNLQSEFSPPSFTGKSWNFKLMPGK